ENSIEEDYCTEKLFIPLMAGSIPVYYGAPNYQQLLPCDNCVINARNMTPEELAANLIKIDKNVHVYNSYLEWKFHPLQPSYYSLWEKSRSDTVACRLCEKVSLWQFQNKVI